MKWLKWLLAVMSGSLAALVVLWVVAATMFKSPDQMSHRPADKIDFSRNGSHAAGDGTSLPYRYSYGYVEFNERGNYAAPKQVENLLDHLAANVARADTVILLYVHGWNHDARAGDTNVACFEELVKATAIMQAGYTSRRGGAPREVYGVFVGWPGLVYPDVRQNATFLGRQNAADRVAVQGALLDLFTRISRIRHQGGATQTKFVIISHSLGARLAYGALRPVMQAAAEAGARSPFLADVAVLVNPALSADAHDWLSGAVGRAGAPGSAPVPVRFLIATSESDSVLQNEYVFSQRATGWTRGVFLSADDLAARPIGLYEKYLTHVLKLEGNYARPSQRGECPTLNHADLEIVRGRRRVQNEKELYDYRTVRHYDERGQEIYKTVLEETGGPAPGPLMVVKVASSIIADHNDIFTSPFVDFVSRVINAGLYGSRK